MPLEGKNGVRQNDIGLRGENAENDGKEEIASLGVVTMNRESKVNESDEMKHKGHKEYMPMQP